MLLYRVFWEIAGGGSIDLGGPMYVPPQGAGRFDNPTEYRILYLSRDERCAIAETFGRFAAWTAALFEPPAGLARAARRALATYEIADGTRFCDLDDPQTLMKLGTRPSRVITRDYSITRALASRVFAAGSAAGLSWWSYYEALWTNVGIWSLDEITVTDVREMRLTDPVLRESATIVGRTVESSR
ncbi:MAG: RES family NAD+ phosphorylase [Candidatus Baltobacteraceae bacterium]